MKSLQKSLPCDCHAKTKIKLFEGLNDVQPGAHKCSVSLVWISYLRLASLELRADVITSEMSKLENLILYFLSFVYLLFCVDAKS